MRVIAFKIWGDYAHFRRHYTTSSPLTHSIPPPSALRGLVAAILGISREEYPDLFGIQMSRFGVRLLKPVKKIRLGLNYMDTKDGTWVLLDRKTMRPRVGKDGHGNPRLHTQVRSEFLKEPEYEIFFNHADESLMEKFKQHLIQHRTIFTPFLGISECIANFEFLWDKQVQPYEGLSSVISAFRISTITEFHWESEIKIVKERIPSLIDNERTRVSSEEVVFHPHGEPITAEIKDVFLYPGTTNRTFGFIA